MDPQEFEALLASVRDMSTEGRQELLETLDATPDADPGAPSEQARTRFAETRKRVKYRPRTKAEPRGIRKLLGMEGIDEIGPETDLPDAAPLANEYARAQFKDAPAYSWAGEAAADWSELPFVESLSKLVTGGQAPSNIAAYEAKLRERGEEHITPVIDAEGNVVNLLIGDTEKRWLNPPGLDAGDVLPSPATATSLAVGGALAGRGAKAASSALAEREAAKQAAYNLFGHQKGLGVAQQMARLGGPETAAEMTPELIAMARAAAPQLLKQQGFASQHPVLTAVGSAAGVLGGWEWLRKKLGGGDAGGMRP